MTSTSKSGTRSRNLFGASLAVMVMIAASPVLAQETAAEEAEDQSPDIVVTGQFLNKGASSATKLDIPVLDTPFSVAAYNDEFLKAIETTSVADLYRYMNGVQRAGNTGYDVTLRGFKSGGGDRASIVMDGLPGLGVRFGSPPTVGVERVEVVKGPTSVLYGQAQPGGFINIISKKPKSQTAMELTFKANKGIGSLDRARGFFVSADITGPLDKNGTFLYRVVAEAGDVDGFRQLAYEHPLYIAPSLAWNIGPDTKLTLMGEYRTTRTHYDNQLAVPLRNVANLPSYDTTYQSASDYQTERGTVGSVIFEHGFTQDLKFNAAYRYVDHFDSAFGYDSAVIRNVANPALATLGRRARGQKNIRTYSFFDANMTADFDTFGLGHKLIVGGSLGKEVASFERTQFYAAPATGLLSLDVSVANPNLALAQPLSFYPLCNITGGTPNTGSTIAACSVRGSSLSWSDTTLKSKGAYFSDLISIGEMFKVMFGVRYADERQDVRDLRILTTSPQSKHDTKWLPLAGIIFKPKENISIYASYSSSFVPVGANSQDIFGKNPFAPTSATSYEGGVKAELFDKRVTATAAYFDIKKKDTINTFTCPANEAAAIAAGFTIPADAARTAAGVLILGTGTCSAAIGGERSKGVELELSANPVDGWTLAMGYTHTEARVTKSNVTSLAGAFIQNGARLTNAPDDTFNIWSRYDFQNGPLKGFGFGLGFAYVGARVGYLPVRDVTTTTFVNEETALLVMPAFSLVDLGLYYEASENLNLTFKVSNLLDKRFIESTGFSGDFQMLPGQPRLATLSARFNF